MYRIWIGLDGKVVLGCLFGAIGIMVLYIHVFAFSAIGYPGHVQGKYPSYTTPPPAAAPVR